MKRFLLLISITLFMNAAGLIAQAGPPVTHKKEHAMNEMISDEELERAFTEAEELYDHGENTKAATLLINLMERSQNDQLRGMLAMVILDNPFPPELALRLARAANGNEKIITTVLDKVEGSLSTKTVNQIKQLQAKSIQITISEHEIISEADKKLQRNHSDPEAQATLLKIIETTTDEQLRTRLIRKLCEHGLRPDYVMRIAKVAKNSENFVAMLSNNASLPVDSLRELLTWMAMHGRLDGDSRYFEMATNGRMPDDFVPAVFPNVNPDLQVTLLVLATEQLRVRADKRLHQFITSVIFGDYPNESRDWAARYLSNAYDSSQALERDRFRLNSDSIKLHFQTFDNFSTILSSWLEDPKFLSRYSTTREYLNFALENIDPSITSELTNETAPTMKLRLSMQKAIAHKQIQPELRDGLLKLMKVIGTSPL